MLQAKKYAAPALEKGLDILELLSEQEFGLSQSEIARALGRSVGEIFRMLVVLQERGYLTLEPGSDKYVLTTFLFEIAHRTPLTRRLTALADPLMRRLAIDINQSVHLTILSGDDILVVGQVDSPGNRIMSVRLGARIDVWRASSGRVILAHQSASDIRERATKSQLPEGVTLKKIQSDLASIREKGYEVVDSFVVRGVVNISAPVIDHSGRGIAALNIPHIERMDSDISIEQCTERLVSTARKLSLSLGGS
ncbi:MAG TPA: IclR family transcriptional regulator [Devosia sp.]|nr:IclR family transcriptional regulator [Devosia sp.]